MFELIVSVCMVTTPSSCKEVHLTYMGDVPTPYQCMHRGQPELAKWSLSNPEWTIRKFSCGRVNTARKAA